jgi:hypothetical protein
MKKIALIGAFVIMVLSFTSCATRAVYVQPGKPGYGRAVRPYYNTYSTPYSSDAHHSYGRGYGGGSHRSARVHH